MVLHGLYPKEKLNSRAYLIGNYKSKISQFFIPEKDYHQTRCVTKQGPHIFDFWNQNHPVSLLLLLYDFRKLLVWEPNSLLKKCTKYLTVIWLHYTRCFKQTLICQVCYSYIVKYASFFNDQRYRLTLHKVF